MEEPTGEVGEHAYLRCDTGFILKSGETFDAICDENGKWVTEKTCVGTHDLLRY